MPGGLFAYCVLFPFPVYRFKHFSYHAIIEGNPTKHDILQVELRIYLFFLYGSACCSVQQTYLVTDTRRYLHGRRCGILTSNLTNVLNLNLVVAKKE